MYFQYYLKSWQYFLYPLIFFECLNFEYNNIIEHIGYSFKTSLVYQLTQFNYQSCGQYLNLKDNSSIQGDLLEYVFVNIISKQKNVKKLKIKKIQYLYQVIICYIKKCF